MRRIVLFAMGLSGLFSGYTVKAAPPTTVAPAWSSLSLADARAQCEKPANVEIRGARLGPGRAVGYPLLAQTDSEWAFIVACERTGFQGETTYGPAWTSQSFAEARKICDVASDTSSLAAGKAVGEPALARTGQNEIYIVICQRPILAPIGGE